MQYIDVYYISYMIEHEFSYSVSTAMQVFISLILHSL